MLRSPIFWISMTVFQFVFGLSVFAITRNYYVENETVMSSNNPAISESTSLPQNMGTSGTGSSLINSTTFKQLTTDSPEQISLKAGSAFTAKEYEKAADLYQQLLVFDPNNVNTFNNLGITLFYLGRSDEAINRLNQGIAADPSYQRIWLTLGYVNSQVGNSDQARTALTKAIGMGMDNEVGKSAQNILDNLGN